MSSNCTYPLRDRSSHVSLGKILLQPFRAVDRALAVWQRRHEERKALGRLSDRLLRDIGITRADVEVEIRKPFWLP